MHILPKYLYESPFINLISYIFLKQILFFIQPQWDLFPYILFIGIFSTHIDPVF